ncbi:long-chain-fatty-acid--CoA ligase [Oceanobacter mangrovi]|uniref:long-chain-fatty-acid--CoA ligase n=1 Tax=Oceanobacter mangrovi TaxID=2862510 RepID=UPI001C8D32CD|nr:long-chain-fatty-acid--CoA ligase [Oceanobacter mangrovi]
MAYQKNFAVWPPGLPHDIELTDHSVYSNLERSVAADPDAIAMVFYETCITYQQLHQDVCLLATWLATEAGVGKGDRVGIFSQNSPQYVIAYYAALRLGAVVVPMNPMYVEEELQYLLDNSGARVLFAANELHHAFVGVMDRRDVLVVGIEYRDYLRVSTELPIPDFILNQGAPADLDQHSHYVHWQQALACETPLVAITEVELDDLVMLPYTSGSTGNPKGCKHSNISVQHGLRGVYDWFGIKRGDVILAVAPMFHVVGLQAGMNSSIAQGGTLVIVPRWDREVAAHAIHNFHVTVWPAVPTMAIDLINMPDFEQYDVSSLRVMFGGGSSMPEAVAKRLYELCGVTFMEGYGMTETCCPGTANPPQAPKAGCAGIPVFNTLLQVVDHETLTPVRDGEIGELLIAGPQVMQGYWQDEQANAESFVLIDGVSYLRTGDLGYLDEQGYVYVVDRLKRMINASGFKVWPTQVEAVLYRHPAIREVCVVAKKDPKRGETVKAMVVLADNHGDICADDLIEWSREHMAAYKIPRSISFVESLPKSGSGKILWRTVQEDENREAIAI